MGRHSKNNNDRAFFTYHERQMAARGYAGSAFYKHANGSYGGGTIHVGSDSLREFDSCCLSLHPCKDPVITPQGYLYEREAILEYIVQKRKEIDRQQQEWEAAQARTAAADRLAADEAKAREIEAFAKNLEGGTAPSAAGTSASASGGAKSQVRGRVINDDPSKHAADMSFWAPQNAPSAKRAVDKPEGAVRCPMSGEKLRAKQLVPVRFTPAPRKAGQVLSAVDLSERYVCPLSKKPIAKTATCVVLRPSGMVITKDSYNTIVKTDMLDPFTDPPAKLKDRDVIPIKTEGTGFAARGETVVKKRGAMPEY
mmetsp:Transcript_27056/g.90544  ORF Transcript_27056/g.90544 Transcript_27056/m.90544 type:complete len:311 (-) Transcript_27056:174-1106(-)